MTASQGAAVVVTIACAGRMALAAPTQARGGSHAADALVATAAALGVTEPYSSGVGGGGFLLYHDASTGRTTTLDSRETAPAGIRRDAFIDPDTGEPYPFTPDLVTSGVSVGVPGTPLLWRKALARWGRLDLGQALAPAARLADRGFVVDRTFHRQTRENAERFRAIRSTRRLFLVDGHAPAVGSRFRNPALAATYRQLGRCGTGFLYRGRLGREVVRTVQHPPTVPGTDLPVPPGSMRRPDLRRYTVPTRPATSVPYRGLRVFGMPPPSSGGSTVGEALNILRRYRLGDLPCAQALHLYLEASARAFADRSAYLGDRDFVPVPLRQLLSLGFARERACTIHRNRAARKPVAAGVPDGSYGGCSGVDVRQQPDTEGRSTTNLVVADRWGDVASYTLTIEQTGGSGITVPGRGFLLNNELTDFSPVYDRADPNRIQGGKRLRSSMAPKIVLRRGEPWLAVGSPGGSTIITTVLQTLLNRIDFAMPLRQAIAAPRATQQNADPGLAEQAFLDRWKYRLARYGQDLVPVGEPGTSEAEIGAVTAVQFAPDGRLLAAAEPRRRGGGSAEVVRETLR